MTELLSNLSAALAAAVELAGQSVVRVEGRRRLPASGIAWSSDLVVTANHVVPRDEGIRLGLPGGEIVEAALVGRDPRIDVAVLRAEGQHLEPAAWADSDALRVGHLVLALGRPGRSVQATLGIVGALGGVWHTPLGGELSRYLQTDVVMYPGFSGGALVDAGGAGQGLNTSALLRGMSLTVPTASVRDTVEALVTHGRVRRGYLGVSLEPVPLPASLAAQLDQESGLLIREVNPGSPADAAGLLLGDVLVALDGHPVRHLDDLQSLLGAGRVGKAVPASIVRGGQVQKVTVVVGERP